VPGEDPSADGGASRVGVGAHLGFEPALDRPARARGSPLALSEVGPAVVTQAHDIDLRGLGPVLSLESGGEALLAVDPGEGLPAVAPDLLGFPVAEFPGLDGFAFVTRSMTASAETGPA
jgi:hypothetical protein